MQSPYAVHGSSDDPRMKPSLRNIHAADFWRFRNAFWIETKCSIPCSGYVSKTPLLCETFTPKMELPRPPNTAQPLARKCQEKCDLYFSDLFLVLIFPFLIFPFLVSLSFSILFFSDLAFSDLFVLTCLSFPYFSDDF